MADPDVSVVRADDLVVQTLRFRHATLQKPTTPDEPATLVFGGTKDDPPLISVEFPPQSVAEQSFPEGGPTPVLGAVKAEFSGPSRLVFRVAPGTRLNYTLEVILHHCRGKPLRVDPPPAPNDTEPFKKNPLDSLLEVPSGLFIHPHPNADFDHRPVTLRRTTNPLAPRTELWHTRLIGISDATAVSASTSGDSVIPLDRRRAIVTNSAQRAFILKRLMLSSLGAWFEAEGDWEGAETVESWRHRSTMGRDHYVQVVEPGFLFPFGHRASRVTVIERKMPISAAHLRSREFVIVRQQEMPYGGYRGVPFRSVTIATSTTPDLVPAAESVIVAGTGAAWIRVKDQAGQAVDLEFQLTAVDRRGRPLSTSRPLAFIPKGDMDNAELLAWMTSTKVDGFGSPGLAPRRVRAMSGQRVAFVEDASATGDSTFDTDSLDIGAETALKAEVDTVKEERSFLPKMLTASARVPAIRELAQSELPVTFSYDSVFLDTGHPPLDVFARLTESSRPRIAFGSPEQAGGLVRPEVQVTALSQRFGPVGGTGDDLANGRFDPASYFPGDLRILGGPTLAEVLEAGTVDVNGTGKGIGIPKLASTETPTETRTTLQWTTVLKGGTVGIFDGTGGTIELDVVRVTPRQNGSPTATVRGTLRGFKVSLPAAHPLIEIPFTVLEFKAETGKKIDVGVTVGRVQFQNELSFVNALSEFIPPQGFDDPPALDVTDTGVRVGYSLAIPTVPLGAITVQNLALGAFFNLPFLGSASMTFALSTRDDPFIVTYSAIGGGGFVSLEMVLDGGMGLEAAIEFGGAVALSIGVASGAVSVMAGIYYGLKPTGVELAAFIRVLGVMEVLGIVSISVEFYLELLYEAASSALVGTATLTVKVKITFFSKKVRLEVSRRLDKGGDPTFEDTVTEADWAQYCGAFGED
jgi:hypothetical protein